MFKLTFAAALAAMAKADDVITGTADNFEGVLSDNPEGVLVEFYAPWCGHCKKLAPEYEKAATALKADGSKVPLVKVDATIETKLAEKFKIQGYPDVKWFVNGKPQEFDGARTADGIQSWIKTMTGPAVIDGEPKEDDLLSATFYGADKKEFEECAKANRKKASWYFVKGSGNKFVIKHKGEDKIEAEADTAAKFEEALKTNSFPLYGALDGESFSKYMESGVGMIWTLMDMTADNMSEVVEESRERMTKIAKDIKADNMTVTHTNTVEFKKVLESMFGITTFPKIIVQTKVGDKKNFIYDGEMTDEGIRGFYKKVKSGEIKPTLKSEEIPEEPQADPVKVIVGKTIETLVFQKEKDVLLEVYAPWCGHCKKLEPEYIKVGKKVTKEGFEDILVIAKMDGTLNDSPVDSLSWSGFPAMFYIKAGSDKPETYEGPRDAKGIWKWIKKNHSQADKIKAAIEKKQKEKAAKETEKPKEEL